MTAQVTDDTSHRLALVTLSLAQLLFLLDATVVNVALPAIQDSLGFDDAGLQWVVAGYSVAFGGLLLLGGRLGDLFGLRRAFVGGLAVFAFASLLAGLAPAPGWLIGCRIVQGVAAAAASPAALSLIATTFAEGPVRDRAMGLYTIIAGVGGPLGLVAGGVLTTYLSWRWVMFVNVPICLALLVLAPRVLRETPPQRRRLDLPGAVLGTAGVTLLILGFVQAAGRGGAGFSVPAVSTVFAAAGLALVAFVAIERRADAPLLPLRFLADRRRSGTLLVLVLMSTAMFGVYFFMTLYVQRVWGYSALRTALVYVPLSLLLMAGAKVSSAIVARVGPRALLLGGFAVAAVGLAWLSRIDDGHGFWLGLMVPTLVTYAGFGVTSVPLTLLAMERVAAGETGLASGLFNTARQVGGALGLSVLGAVALGSGLSLASGVEAGFLVAAGVTVGALIVAAISVGRTRPAAAERA